jgi:cytidylate kinase
MGVAAFGRYAAAHPEVDVELDARMAARGRLGGVVL